MKVLQRGRDSPPSEIESLYSVCCKKQFLSSLLSKCSQGEQGPSGTLKTIYDSGFDLLQRT